MTKYKVNDEEFEDVEWKEDEDYKDDDSFDDKNTIDHDWNIPKKEKYSSGYYIYKINELLHDYPIKQIVEELETEDAQTVLDYYLNLFARNNVLLLYKTEQSLKEKIQKVIDKIKENKIK